MSHIGAWLFKQRSYTGIPVFAVLGCVFWKEYERDVLVWSAGPILVLCGSTLRFWAVRHIGRQARTRRAKVDRLVTTGPYVLMRNPLYLGNLMIGLGACVLSELLWMIPVFLVLFVFQYGCIIAWEQDVLRQRFGVTYGEYLMRTPALIPRLSNLRYALAKPALNMREALQRERDTVIGVAVMLMAFLAKEVVG